MKWRSTLPQDERRRHGTLTNNPPLPPGEGGAKRRVRGVRSDETRFGREPRPSSGLRPPSPGGRRVVLTKQKARREPRLLPRGGGGARYRRALNTRKIARW